MRLQYLLCLVMLVGVFGACGTLNAPTATPTPVIPLYRNPAAPIAERVEDLLQRMTLAEKIGQMTLIEKNSITADQVRELAIGGVLSGGGGYPRDENS
ncbi:MAG: beta-glucosidase, partial [Chloroflexus aggregans]